MLAAPIRKVDMLTLCKLPLTVLGGGRFEGSQKSAGLRDEGDHSLAEKRIAPNSSSLCKGRTKTDTRLLSMVSGNCRHHAESCGCM